MMWMCLSLFVAFTFLPLETLATPYDHEINSHHDYSFSYGVKDLHTGDVKNQWEKKDGEVVHGQYSMMEADGSVRIVDYTADEKHGFNAVVKHEGPAYHVAIKYPSSHSEVNLIKAKDEDVVVPASNHHQDEDDDNAAYVITHTAQEQPLKKHNYYAKITTNSLVKQLPIDLNLLKGDNLDTKHIPLEVNLLNPVVIDLTKLQKDDLSSGKLTTTKSLFSQPEIEHGFKPISKYSELVTEIPSPNTFRSNKKPITTPGLSTYATSNHKLNVIKYDRPFYKGPSKIGSKRKYDLRNRVSRYGYNTNVIKHVRYLH